MEKEKIFFTADHHFNHKNIIKFTNRPFGNLYEMNKILIERWNEKVKDDDIVYHVGDFFFGSEYQARKILEKLNGKIHLIWGNHEKATLKNEWRFESIEGTKIIKVPDEDTNRKTQVIVLSHCAYLVWFSSHYDSWNLHGHSHGNLEERQGFKQCDVGVDCWDFYPVSYLEIKDKFKNDFYQK